jgi:hypothetical protein
MRKYTLILAVIFALIGFLPTQSVQAAKPGDLIKNGTPTIYFLAEDGKRYAFPDEATYKSWYKDWSQVRVTSEKEVNSYSFGGVVTVRPGERPVKFKSSSRVYGVSKGGQLRWIRHGWLTEVIYGKDWYKKLIVLPDERFADYSLGADVTDRGQYWWKVERDSVASISEDRVSTGATGRVVYRPSSPAVALAAANPRDTNGMLILIPNLVNDNGSSATKADILFFIENDRVYPEEGNWLKPGNYTAYAGEFPGYTVSKWSGDCTPEGAVYIPKGETRACFITFDDIPGGIWGSIANRPPQLTLIAEVLNNNGGTKTAKDVKLFIESMMVVSGQPSFFNPGDYTMYKVDLPGYTVSMWKGNCTPQGTITLRKGEEKQCIVTYDDL